MWSINICAKKGFVMNEIKITDIENIKIGQIEDVVNGTGCTVFLCEDGMGAGLDIRGGGPASRDSGLLDPLAAADVIHAAVLAGGSAFGLDAAGGVQQFLEENGIGFDVGITKVPLVCQADLFDLTVGNPMVRPDKQMGYLAAKTAFDGGNYQDGNYGAGCGATVGKWKGMDYCIKSGIGSYAVQIGDLKIGAVVAVNSLGDIYDWKTGKQIAGLLSDDKKYFVSTEELMIRNTEVIDNKFTGNTTIGVVITNAKFTKSQLCKIASMTHNGYARAIRPVHTTADGDSIFALSVGTVSADLDIVGSVAANVMSEAILRAVKGSVSAYGIPSIHEIGCVEPF